MTTKVRYHSNNSGGSWWLTDENWRQLEEAGWAVEWGNSYFCHGEYVSEWQEAPPGKPTPCPEGTECPGHRRYDSYAEAIAAGDRFLGAIANYASVEVEEVGIAIREFERITGQVASDEGCNCCGAPHSFSWDGGYASGEDCLPYLFPGKTIPKNLREALEG